MREREADTQVMTDHSIGAETTAFALLMVNGMSEANAQAMPGSGGAIRSCTTLLSRRTSKGDASFSGSASCTKACRSRKPCWQRCKLILARETRPSAVATDGHRREGRSQVPEGPSPQLEWLLNLAKRAAAELIVRKFRQDEGYS
jgi:hypothetical protein